MTDTRSRPDTAGDGEQPSALFDYIKNGGDDLALAKASLEHTLGCLGREIELHAETRKLVVEMLAALEGLDKFIRQEEAAGDDALWTNDYAEMIADCREAIAKARGVSPYVADYSPVDLPEPPPIGDGFKPVNRRDGDSQ